ncbi:hypothetical protein K432DRAFT_288555 [Lepidopterella palustris CBS 459.81]|uniref:DUF985 domain-containing protein n=1 Tax=Lepidopterella palustris CBS 459.81 TaxID=1314670 RepID=A0A8E2EIN9_9PEZI|nr:hypothetical protein K432DRAFT_288555 [Lepidopterella palustris CBS 459.81]
MPTQPRSAISPTLAPLRPMYACPTTPAPEPPSTASLIRTLRLQPHIEGGYFAETDRDPLRVPNPFLARSPSPTLQTARPAGKDGDATRSASTSIFYLLTKERPLGAWHRNRGRTVHTLHWGRGRYVVIHADEVGEGGVEGGKARVETFVVGRNVEKGERLQWVVEGGKYKASFLLGEEEEEEEEDEDEEDEGKGSERGLLISETVVPGFEYSDHDFLRPDRLRELVTPEQAEELAWMLRSGPPPEEHELEYKNR